MEFRYNFAKNGDEQKMALSVCRTVIDDFARELLKHGTAAFPIACYHDDLQTEPVPWHWHEELEVLVVSEGTILATAAGEKYRLEKGEGLFINAGVLHGDWPLNAGPCRLHSMVFHPRLVGHAPAVQALPKKALRSADRIKTMLQFIQEHYAEDVSVEQIAASAAISPSECLRCFHDMIGTTPNQYLRDQRTQRAAELLCDTGLQVSEIAAQCGFQDASYFARAFRQVYGCGPTEYRRKARRAGAV